MRFYNCVVVYASRLKYKELEFCLSFYMGVKFGILY